MRYPEHPIQPSIYGIEYERRLEAYDNPAAAGTPLRDERIVERIANSPVNDIVMVTIFGTESYSSRFSRNNGGKHYADAVDLSRGADDGPFVSVAYETATPETACITDAITYQRAMVRQSHQAIHDFLVQSENLTAISYQYRGTYGPDNTVGQQVNLGLPQPALDTIGLMRSSPGYQHVATSLGSAIALTGGGEVRPDGQTGFSQKAGNTTRLTQHSGEGGSIYELPHPPGEYHTHQPVEIRLADPHPGRWAEFMQLGLAGIALTVAQFPDNRLEGTFGPLPDILAKLPDYNTCLVLADGTIRPTQALAEAASWMLHLSEFYLDNIHQLDEAPRSELIAAAHESITFIDDMSRVVAGEATIDSLASRASWAHRFAYLLRNGQPRIISNVVRFDDPDSLAAHRAYDQVRIEDADGQARISHGPAFTDRPEEHNVPWYTSPEAEDHAIANPPANTRAAARTHILRTYDDFIGINWSMMSFYRATDGRSANIYLPDPTNPALPEDVRAELETHAPRRRL